MQIMLLVFEFQIYRFIFLHIFKKHVHQKLVCYSLTMRKIVLQMYISINTEILFLLKIWPTLLKYHISKDVYVFYKLFLYRIVFHLHCTYFICIVLFCHLYSIILFRQRLKCIANIFWKLIFKLLRHVSCISPVTDTSLKYSSWIENHSSNC